MRTAPALLLALTCACLPACSRWKEERENAAPVWADDGAAIAYIHREYEFKANFIVSGGDYRNQRYQLRTLDPETDTDQALGPFFDGDPFALFFMRQGGYLVVGTEAGPYDLMDLAGNVLASFRPQDDRACPRDDRSFQRFEVIPSLDGDRLAVVETRESCTITVTFHDGPPGFAAGPSFTIAGLDFDAAAWTRSGRLLVESCSDTCGDGHWLVDPDTGVAPLPEVADAYVPCLFVATSSSFVRPDGTAVFLDYDAREVLIGPIADSPEWDGQSFPADYTTPGCAELDG